MRYIIASATAFTLVVGIVIGFALTATVFEAEAKQPEPAGGRTILVAENVVVGGNEGDHTTSFIATPDCGALSVFTEGSGTLPVSSQLLLSADGVVTNARQSGSALNIAQKTPTNVFVFANSAGPILAPFVAVRLSEPAGAFTVTVDKAWLFCAR